MIDYFSFLSCFRVLEGVSQYFGSVGEIGGGLRVFYAIVTIYHIMNISLWTPVVFLRFWSFHVYSCVQLFFSIINFGRFVREI